MKVIIGADHAGFKLKESIKKYLKRLGYKVEDVGAKKYIATDDYPIYAKKAAKKVGKQNKAILFCGSAEGICIAANKTKGIRGVAVWTLTNAKLSRQHNDANVLCLSGWQLPLAKAKKIVKLWLETPFSGEERHKRRIKQLE